MKTFYFLSGLPRSGSTVLASILNQNPEVFVTPTSPLLDQLISNQNIWRSLQTVKANPVPDQLTNVTRELIQAMWDHIPQDIIVDKNRGWGKNLPAARILFEKDIKMIATTRDLPSIMASWLVLLKQNSDNYMVKQLINNGIIVTDESIMNCMWEEMVKDCFEGLNQAFKDAIEGQLLVIEYDDLINDPRASINSVESFLELPKYNYDFNNISSKTNDDDLAAWGLNGMHKIRPTLCKTSRDPLDVLGKNLFVRFSKLEKHYRRK